MLSQEDNLALLLPASRGESLPSGKAEVSSRKVAVVPRGSITAQGRCASTRYPCWLHLEPSSALCPRKQSKDCGMKSSAAVALSLVVCLAKEV